MNEFDFPILSQKTVTGKRIVYLDSAATTQKPKQVISEEQTYYETMNANVHRGIYELSEKATQAYEHSRKTVAEYIHASSKEIIFTKGTTESINLLAYCLGKNLKPGDEILISIMEHHSNFVPWQQVALEKKCKLVVANITNQGILDITNFKKKLNAKTKIVALTHVSNVLGCVNDIKSIATLVHKHNAVLIVDAAQSIAHVQIDVAYLDVDFLAFSAHKMYGPTGVGVLFGKEKLLHHMHPFLFGGDMISKVTIEESTWADIPHKFEAGTPNVAGVITFGKAIHYLKSLGYEKIQKHEYHLMKYAMKELSKIKGITIYGPEHRMGVVSFNIDGIHAHDLATLLDREGICIRAGHHCCMPLMHQLKIPASARISLGVYNTKEDIDACIVAIHKAKKVFKIA